MTSSENTKGETMGQTYIWTCGDRITRPLPNGPSNAATPPPPPVNSPFECYMCASHPPIATILLKALFRTDILHENVPSTEADYNAECAAILAFQAESLQRIFEGWVAEMRGLHPAEEEGIDGATEGLGHEGMVESLVNAEGRGTWREEVELAVFCGWFERMTDREGEMD